MAQDGMPRCGWFQNIGSFHYWTMGYLLIDNEGVTLHWGCCPGRRVGGFGDVVGQGKLTHFEGCTVGF